MIFTGTPQLPPFNMKTPERYLWIGAVILIGFAFQNQVSNSNNLETILETYHAETQIQNSAIMDFNNQLHSVRDNFLFSRGLKRVKLKRVLRWRKGTPSMNTKMGIMRRSLSKWMMQLFLKSPPESWLSWTPCEKWCPA